MKIEVTNREKKSLMNIVIQDRIYRTACLDSIALISNRIQQDGKKSDETKIGNYKKSYAKYREKKGRQTNYIDITFTGETIDGLTFEKTASNEYSVGFISKKSADKAEWNEARFGTLFELSDNEIELVTTAIENNVNEAIGR